jgi:hypothetical protein
VSSVSLQIDVSPRRNRLTAFFRSPLSLPLVLANYVYGIIAYIAVVGAWFAIVITGRFPAGLYGFIGGYVRFLLRADAYMMLAVDAYPPINGAENPDYPVHVLIGERKERYSRLKTFFRGIYVIPAYLVLFALMVPLLVVVLLSWFAIVITGRQPQAFSRYTNFTLRWMLTYAALAMLVAEDY